MKYFFEPKNLVSANAQKAFRNNPFVQKVASALANQSIHSQTQYQKVLENIIQDAKKSKVPPTKISIHPKELPSIKKHKPLTEETLWGGVALKKVDVGRNFIQKLLVVNEHGILGFEFHKEKLEKLNVLEGYCLVFSSIHNSKNWKKGKITVKLATIGDKFEFQPNDEHGIIALTGCVIEETSTNHLDDLFYIFKSSQI